MLSHPARSGAPTISLVDRIRCPVCLRPYREGHAPAGGTIFPHCQGKRCQAVWWAMELEQGESCWQLSRTLGEAGAAMICGLVNIPDTIDKPLYLQVLIRGIPLTDARKPGGILSLVRAAGL